MKVRYMPEAGFGQAPAFVEYEGDVPTDQAPRYQRQRYLRFTLDCRNVEVFEQWNMVLGGGEEPDTRALSQRFIRAIGVIGRARWSRFSLSFLGSSKIYEELTVSIHRSSGAAQTYLAGNTGIDDIDILIEPGFFLEIYLEAERYDDLEIALVRPGARLRILVEAGCFRSFYATWSPALSEGRVIKFLDAADDVENAAEMPKGMADRSGQPEEDGRTRSPVEIEVVWPIGERTEAAGYGEQADDESSRHEAEREEHARRVEEVHRSVKAIVAHSMRKKALGRIAAFLMIGALLAWGAVTWASRM